MKIETVLREHKRSITPERVKMFDFFTHKHLSSASDIEQAFPELGRASIFRTLRLFLKIGVIRRVALGERGENYELVDEDSHHEHMKCSKCGKVVSFESADICQKIFSEAQKIGFHVTEHSLSILGVCKNCMT